MSNKFLTHGNEFSIEQLQDGSASLYIEDLQISTLGPSEFVLTDSQRRLISSPTLTMSTLDITGDLNVGGNVDIGVTNYNRNDRLTVAGQCGFCPGLAENVVIGIDSGTEMFFNTPATAGFDTFVFSNLPDATTTNRKMQMYNANDGSSKGITIRRGGQIGIGATAPTELLTVGGNSLFDIANNGQRTIQIEGATNTELIYNKAQTGNFSRFNIVNVPSASLSFREMQFFYSTLSPSIKISRSAGDVMIGNATGYNEYLTVGQPAEFQDYVNIYAVLTADQITSTGSIYGKNSFYDSISNATQSINNATETVALFATNNTSFGQTFSYSSGVITLNATGTYLVNYKILFAANVTGYRYTYIKHESSTPTTLNQVGYNTVNSSLSTADTVLSGSAVIDVGTSTDTISIIAYQNSGAALNINGNTVATQGQITIYKLGSNY